MRIRVPLAGWLAGLLVLGNAALMAQPIVVRDVHSGIGIEATIELAALPDDAPATTAALTSALDEAERSGSLQWHQGLRPELEVDGRMVARVSRPGYRPLLTVVEPASDVESWTLWLSRQPSGENPPEDAPVDTVHGHVIDPTTLGPMSNVQLHLDGGHAVSVSDATGAFNLPFPPGRANGVIERAQLVAIAPDGRRVERTLALAPGSDVRLILDFHNAGRDDAGHRHLLTPDAPAQRVDPGTRAGPFNRGATAPPASVRVGYADASCTTSCCTGSCNHVCVFDLETYVRRGLNDEWIASWNTQALRAGSVAYRSYGAWHALNPVPGRAFDICSSACCQVNDGDTSSSTDLAVSRTAGILLERDNAVFRSEYSAENNCRLGAMSCANVDLSCGNGFAGSPAASWPCLADPVGIDRDCFGHGRGMSQWGTQRWSLAPHQQTWRWQVNHYYNAHGTGNGLRTAVMTRVLALADVRPRQRTATAGSTLLLDYDAVNHAAITHDRVLVGASLKSLPGPFIDDPENDAQASLPTNESAVQRRFDLPADISPGRYDVYGSLYLDIDEDGTISSTDFAQDLIQRPAALRVVAASDLIFYDGLQ